MSLLRRSVVALPSFAALLASHASVATAQAPVAVARVSSVPDALPNTVATVALIPDRRSADLPLFSWSGTVDREVFIVMRGRDVDTRGRDEDLPSRVRVARALPRGHGELRVNVEEGRGNVGVIEQPSARNGYQAVIRIQDTRGGADRYRLAVYWEGNGRRDRDDDWGRDDRNRDRDRDDRGRNERDERDRGGNGGYNPNGPDRGALQWRGRVDDVVEIRVQGRRVDYITRRGAQVTDVRADIDGAGLPRRAVDVVTFSRTGRGEVQVVQQPNARNNFTAVIRVHDPRGGSSIYDFSARW